MPRTVCIECGEVEVFVDARGRCDQCLRCKECGRPHEDYKPARGEHTGRCEQCHEEFAEAERRARRDADLEAYGTPAQARAAGGIYQ